MSPLNTSLVSPTSPTLPMAWNQPGNGSGPDVWTTGQVWLSPQLDYALVELAARTFNEIVVYRRALAAGPLLQEPIVSASGKQVGTRVVSNPAARMLWDAEVSLFKWLIVLAAPPTSRAVLGLVRVKAKSSLEELLRGPEPAGDRQRGRWLSSPDHKFVGESSTHAVGSLR